MKVKKTKTKRRTLKAKADALWSKLIRSWGCCVRCGATSWLQAAHIISRKYGNTRHQVTNGICLCAKCHRWAHDWPVEFGAFATHLVGKAEIERLGNLARSMIKPDYEQATQTLQDELKKKNL